MKTFKKYLIVVGVVILGVLLIGTYRLKFATQTVKQSQQLSIKNPNVFVLNTTEKTANEVRIKVRFTAKNGYVKTGYSYIYNVGPGASQEINVINTAKPKREDYVVTSKLEKLKNVVVVKIKAKFDAPEINNRKERAAKFKRSKGTATSYYELTKNPNYKPDSDTKDKYAFLIIPKKQLTPAEELSWWIRLKSQLGWDWN